jgi:hypothetical protein
MRETYVGTTPILLTWKGILITLTRLSWNTQTKITKIATIAFYHVIISIFQFPKSFEGCQSLGLARTVYLYSLFTISAIRFQQKPHWRSFALPTLKYCITWPHFLQNGSYDIYCLSYRTQLIVLIFIKIHQIFITEYYGQFCPSDFSAY